MFFKTSISHFTSYFFLCGYVRRCCCSGRRAHIFADHCFIKDGNDNFKFKHMPIKLKIRDTHHGSRDYSDQDLLEAHSSA